jgi:AcrR family transcriptional regulator
VTVTTQKSGARRARPPRTRLLVDERRAQLLALGIRAFSKRPYDEIAIDDLARAAGVSKGLLYHYYPTKRDFYVAALDQASKQLLAETLTAEGAPPEERVKVGLEAYLDFVERHDQAYVALMRGGIGSDKEVQAILEGTRATFVERIVENVPKKLVTPLVRIALRGWIGFVEATATQWLAGRAVKRSKLLDLLAGVLIQSIQLAGGEALLAS